MADTSVTEAIFSLRYSVGDSVQQLASARRAAEDLAAAGEKAAVSEERLTRSSQNLLAALDPRTKAEMLAARQLEQVNRLYTDGAIGAQRYAQAVGRIEENYLKVGATNDNAVTSFGRLRGMLGTVTALFGTLGLSMSAIAAVGFVRDVRTMAGELDDLAQTVGVTTDELQAYRTAALEAGASTKIADDVLQKYTRAVGQAHEGNKKMVEAFQHLNLTAQDIAGDPGKTLPKVVTALSELGSVTERAAIETALFSRAGQQVEQVLKAWGTPIDEQIARFKDLGLIISEDQIKAIDKADARYQLFFQHIKVGLLDLMDFLTTAQNGSPVEQIRSGANVASNPFAGLIPQSILNPSPSFGELGRPAPFGGPLNPFQDTVAVTPRVADPFGLGAQTEAASKAFDTAMEKQSASVDAFEKDYRESMARLSKSLNEKIARDLKAEQDWRSKQFLLGKQSVDDHEKFMREQLDAALKYGEEMIAAERERVKKAVEAQSDALDKQAEATKRYWEDVHDEMSATTKDFWLEFVDTGELNFDTLTRRMKQTWASVLIDMARQWAATQFSRGSAGGGGYGTMAGMVGGLFGGGATGGAGYYNGVPMGINVTPAQGVGSSGAMWGGAASMGLGLAAGVAKAQESPGDNTRISSGLQGAATGAMVGTMILPGIGTAVGAIIGAVAGLIAGADKISDMRSVATFTPGMTDFGIKAQSAHESSEKTLGMAGQAAEAIAAEVSALKAAGVEFKSQLANVWIGERDASTFQLAGGRRVSAGTVGDPADLATDALNALIAKATSSDPEIRAILAKSDNFAELRDALNFYQQITTSLGQITDPLKAAIDLWKKESQARLDMAAATGVSIDKVQQLNTALYQQIVGQQNAGALASIGGLIDQIEYGPGSTKAPGTQYASALADYQAAQRAAMGGGAEEAQAYVQAASSFLPFARSYLGTTREYGQIETGALDTLKGLQTSLSQPTMMPNLVMPIMQTGAATVEAVTVVASEVKSMREDLRAHNALIFGLMQKVA